MTIPLAPRISVEPAADTRPVSAGWVLGPWLDLLFLANFSWPLVAWFVGSYAETAAHQAFGFLLAYFVILPHRWITLALVFCDRQKFASRPRGFLLVLAGVVALCSSVRLAMETLALLVAIDYLWNAWHFAAQHSGVLGIYGRQAWPENPGVGRYEKYGLRAFLLYVLLRLTGAFIPPGSVPWLDWVAASMPHLAWLDFLALAYPASLLAREVLRFRPAALGRLAYMTSLACLYGGLLLAIRSESMPAIVGLAAATTLFHSTEYLAVVTWYVGKNRSLAASPLWSRLLSRWVLSLLAFMAFFALSAYMLRERFVEAWLWINLNVSLLHYAYDGMIWKRPKKR